MKIYKEQKINGTNYIYLQDKNGIYKGKSRVHPDDLKNNNWSYFRGYRLAQNRAWINFYKNKIKQEKIKLKTILNLKKDFIFTFEEKNIPKNILRRLNLKIRDYTNNIENYKNQIAQIEKEIEENEKLYSSILNKRDKSKEKT